MSILLQQDVHPDLPGKSACIIFLTDMAANDFLSANGWNKRLNQPVGLTSYATSPTVVGVKRQNGLSSISLLPGAPYPLDTWLSSMQPPKHARRRIKWSRSRLFYDVSLKQFKKDVLSTVGGPANVEFFHFYNPGECTVVFASVGIASACLAAFEQWKKEKLVDGTRWLKEDEACIGKTIGHLDRKKGREYCRDSLEGFPILICMQGYEGVDVGMLE